MMNPRCEHCGTQFEARRRTARFCGGRCQKAAARRREPQRSASTPPSGARTLTRPQIVAELDAMVELLEADANLLEARFTYGEDPEIDDLISGMWAHLAGAELVRAWFTRKERALATP